MTKLVVLLNSYFVFARPRKTDHVQARQELSKVAGAPEKLGLYFGKPHDLPLMPINMSRYNNPSEPKWGLIYTHACPAAPGKSQSSHSQRPRCGGKRKTTPFVTIRDPVRHWLSALKSVHCERLFVFDWTRTIYFWKVMESPSLVAPSICQLPSVTRSPD